MDFTGSWDTNWGTVELTQIDAKVTGSYSGPFNGTIEGDVMGSALSFKWFQPNGQWGKGVFTLGADGNSFTGSWGTGEAEPSDDWSGTRAGI